MQEMDVDVDVFDYLPSVLRKIMVCHNRIYTNARHFSDFIVTGGRKPALYEINGKQILSSLDLSTTVFKDVVLPNSMPTDDTLNISINVYFSYKKKVKEPFFFLHIDNHLAVLGKIDQRFVIYREFARIIEYRIVDLNSSGESDVEIVYIDGPSELIQLSSLSYSPKGIELNSMTEHRDEFDKMTRNLRDRVTKVSCELAEINANIQKEIQEYKTYCQTIDSNSNENIRILSRYGDFWIRNINNHVLIGIPVYNCSSSKNLVEKIRLSLFTSNRSQFMYTHKLYAFQTETVSIEPLKFQEICEQNDNDSQNDLDKANDSSQMELVFNHEWTDQRQFVLYPDNAAVIIIKMDLKDFELDANGREFDIFTVYNVFLETGLWKEFQTHLATVKIDSDIFHDKRYAVCFDSNKIYQDLLAVVASTERQMFRLQFDDDIQISQLHDLLLHRLSFDSISTSLNIEDNFRFFLSQNLDLTTSMHHFEEDHQMYYTQNGYWTGTLIRIRTVNDAENTEIGEFYEMKVYNRDDIKIKNLISTFRNEFGRKISIEPLSCCNRASLEMELKCQFREEVNALDELARHLKFKTFQINKRYNEFIESQYKTDCIWAELIKDEPDEPE